MGGVAISRMANQASKVAAADRCAHLWNNRSRRLNTKRHPGPLICHIGMGNASKYLEDLLAAEKKASDGKLCLHNLAKEPPVAIFSDLSVNTKQAKEFEAMVTKRKDRTFRGVVEFCFSGMKFKVRLEQEGRLIGFCLLGVRTMAQDKNQPTLLEYANDALHGRYLYL